MREKVTVAIVGAGPAGCAAAIFLKRAGLEPILFEERLEGGLLREANLVENYPGFPEGIAGKELAELMALQVARLHVRLEKKRIVEVSSEGESFTIRAEDAEYQSRAVVIANGTTPKRLELPGVSELEGRRLFYGLASLDTERISGKRVVVLGGGDAAFDYSLNLQARGNSVTILMRSTPTALGLLRERAACRGIEVHEMCAMDSVSESEEGVGVRVECSGGRRFDCDLVVVAHGREPRLDALSEDLGRLVGDSDGYIPETPVKGLYMAGDAVRGECRQTAIAVGDGVLAAMRIMRFLEEER